MPAARAGAGAAAAAGALRQRRRTRRRFNRARQRVLRRREALRRNVQLRDRIGLLLDLLHFQLRRLRDRNGDLVLARHLRLTRRFLHPVAAAAAAAARSGLAQPDDVGVGLLGQQRGRGHARGCRTESPKHDEHGKSDVRDERDRRTPGRCASAAARRGTGSRPDARLRREQTDARQIRSRGLPASGSRPSGMLWGSSRYCCAPVSTAATAKGVPRTSSMFARTRPGQTSAGVSRFRRVRSRRQSRRCRRRRRTGRPARRRRAARCGSATRMPPRATSASKMRPSCAWKPTRRIVPDRPSFARSRALPCSASTIGPCRTAGPMPAMSSRPARRAERLLEERGRLGRVLRENRQRLRRQARLLQRGNPLGRPRDVLKHADGEPSSLDLNHGRVMYHGGQVRRVAVESGRITVRLSD